MICNKLFSNSIIEDDDNLMYEPCPRCGGKGFNVGFIYDSYNNDKEVDEYTECEPCNGTGNEIYPFMNSADKEEYLKNRKLYISKWIESERGND